mgnify:CR=1 FL=1
MRRMGRNDLSYQSGSALILVLLVLIVLSLLITTLSHDVGLDLAVSRNLRLKNDALNWAEGGLDAAHEMIAIAMETRGEDNGTSYSLGNGSYTVENTGGNTLMFNNSTVHLASQDGTVNSTVDVTFLGTETADGNSIIIAAGYEGVGKGVGAGIAVQHYYVLRSKSTSRQGEGIQKASEVYRYSGGDD